ncbi:MAG: threonine--tRNA ligase [Spirochaetales bacterium]|nr:threonine--tRNA ligase [Spirochaetales bacterium]
MAFMGRKEKKDGDAIPLSTMRHSAAHVMAQALTELFPEADLAIGPDIENGFYYDVSVGRPILPEDLREIENRMQRIVKSRQKFERFYLPAAEALAYLQKRGQKYKLEMARDLIARGETQLSFYRNLDRKGEAFVDMCDGPHVEHTGQIGHYKLTSVAGAYWRGDSSRDQLQRIYGWLFHTREELTAHEHMVEESRKRDHRKLGGELELFTTSETIGPGLILWLPRGNVIKEELERWAMDTERKWGYDRVTTPVITKEDLFFTSEHLPHYKDSMFPPMVMDNQNYYIKPMNCPFHHTIYSVRPRSYRELPIRLAEYGTCHRYEDSGALLGLMRVRGFSMNDAHIYCTEEQAVEEFVRVMELHEYYYKTLNIAEYHMVLSLRNPANEKYHGDEAMWQKAEALTRKAMEVSGIQYEVEEDGAAFYGPKVDFQIKSSIGRLFTASTCQLDLFMPEKFNLTYIDSDGQEKRPVCLHRSPLGTHERFIGFLIEHFAGAFPAWLAPEQVRILPVIDKFSDYAREVLSVLVGQGVRATVDDSGETLGKRIRNAEKWKIPYMLVLGEKEVESRTVAVRNYFTGKQDSQALGEWVLELQEEIREKKIQQLTKKH